MPIRNLLQEPTGKVRQPKERERAFCSGPIRSAGSVVETDAGMTSRYDHVGDDQVLRMIGLQVRCDDADLLLELLERDAWNNAHPLNPSTAGHTMITVQCPQQRRLTGAVVAMNDPAVARSNLE